MTTSKKSEKKPAKGSKQERLFCCAQWHGKLTITGFREGVKVPASLVIPAEINGQEVDSIDVYAFSDCEELTSVTISNGITKIGSRAFNACERLARVSIPGSVKTIGPSAFIDCVRLKDLELANGVEAIEAAAFYDCNRLARVTIPASVKRIGEGAFSGCRALKAFAVARHQSTFKSKGPMLFSKDGKSLLAAPSASGSVTIPNGVTAIGPSAFDVCDHLQSVVIPAGVTRIGNSAFSKCRALAQVTIPDSVKSIGPFAFSQCDNLKRVTIPASVKRIGPGAFTITRQLAIPRGRPIYLAQYQGNAAQKRNYKRLSAARFFGAVSLDEEDTDEEPLQNPHGALAKRQKDTTQSRPRL